VPVSEVIINEQSDYAQRSFSVIIDLFILGRHNYEGPTYCGLSVCRLCSHSGSGLGQACGEQLLNYAKYLGIRLLDPRAADWCVPLTYRESREWLAKCHQRLEDGTCMRLRSSVPQAWSWRNAARLSDNCVGTSDMCMRLWALGY
jgi:hypothetical protein